MKKLNFYIADVFAEQKYQGNQLAVFYPAEGLSAAEMQKIAREMNFAETSFIVSNQKEVGAYQVRIFTPDKELPFAGHPSLGTAYIIRSELEREPSEEAPRNASSAGNHPSEPILLNLPVGQIPVTAEPDGTMWMKQKPPQFGALPDPEEVLNILGLTRFDLDKRFPVQQVSTGLPSIIVPLNSLDAVRRCRVNHELYARFLKSGHEALLQVFCDQTYHNANTLNVRVFTFDKGYPEDAATGSANGNLAGYLLKHDFFSSSRIAYKVEQGFEMGRPSLLYIGASYEGSKFDINVGGKVILNAKGEWLL